MEPSRQNSVFTDVKGNHELLIGQKLVNETYFDLQMSIHEFVEAKDDFHHDIVRN